MTDVSNVPQEPRDVPCPYPEVVNGACRNHILHPDAFGCDRCKGAKQLPDVKRAPKASAKIGDWIDFAVSTGAGVGYASSRSREELVAEFADRLPNPAPTFSTDEPGEITPVDNPANTTVDVSLVATTSRK